MVATQTLNPRVDAITQSPSRSRGRSWRTYGTSCAGASPEVEETIKWSRPFFEYRGVIL